jgi:hypothetical protein
MLFRRTPAAPPQPPDIQAALDRVCASPPFDHAPKLTRFLRFIVGKTLAGEASRLKGYTIGVEALGRGEDFDPQVDPIVRVEAIRLRAALARYYTGPGARDPVTIELPRGGYVPRFGWRARHGRANRIEFVAAVRKLGRLLNLRVVLQPAEPAPAVRLPRRNPAATTAPRWPKKPTNPTS